MWQAIAEVAETAEKAKAVEEIGEAVESAAEAAESEGMASGSMENTEADDIFNHLFDDDEVDSPANSTTEQQADLDPDTVFERLFDEDQAISPTDEIHDSIPDSEDAYSDLFADDDVKTASDAKDVTDETDDQVGSENENVRADEKEDLSESEKELTDTTEEGESEGSSEKTEEDSEQEKETDNSTDQTESQSENDGQGNEVKDEKETHEGLTDEQKQKLRELTGWSDEIIDAIGSWKEAEIYMKAGLKEVEINGKKCLIRDDIDLDQKDEDGITNRERMERGRPPITRDGEEIELHHIGQKQSSPLAELTTEEHRGVGNDTILHDKTKESEIDRNEFSKERHEHWKDRAGEQGDLIQNG